MRPAAGVAPGNVDRLLLEVKFPLIELEMTLEIPLQTALTAHGPADLTGDLTGDPTGGKPTDEAAVAFGNLANGHTCSSCQGVSRRSFPHREFQARRGAKGRA